MADPSVLVLQRPDGTELRRLRPGRSDTVYDTLVRGGVHILSRCRGSTICGLCRVRVLTSAAELPVVLPDEQSLLQRFGGDEHGARLACRLRAPSVGELVVSTPYW